jgi:D-alanyl-lipoteichoic acid acyltransferase DltB (MBOAT superfamily)
LGGSRETVGLTLRNLMVVALLSGLWHGASWTFVIWGGLHGLYLVVYHAFRYYRPAVPVSLRATSPVFTLLSWLGTQLVVCLAWVLFRSESFSAFVQYVRGLWIPTGQQGIEVTFVVVLAFGAFIADHVGGWWLENGKGYRMKIPAWAQGLAYATIIFILFYAQPEHVSPFIYFQF